MVMKKSDGSITIKDIAAECGVSVSTVSNVLNAKSNKVSKEVTDRILSVVKEKGYKPNYLAQNLRASSTKTIGIIVEDLILFSTSPIIEGAMQKAEDMGYSVVIENVRLFGRWNDKWMHEDGLYQSALLPVMSKMEALHVDGIVYIAGYEHEVRIPNRPEGVPFAVVYASSEDKTVPCFKLDDEAGGYALYSYLYSMGHRKIAIITGESSSPHTVNRLRGIQKAMFERGVLFDPSVVTYQTWNKEGGYKGMSALEGADITAVICMSDLIASGVYGYLLEKGKRPGKDLAIIGYDNHEVSELLTPQLTTISLSLEEMGEAAVSWLVDDNNSKDRKANSADKVNNVNNANNEIRIAGEIIERESVFKIE